MTPIDSLIGKLEQATGPDRAIDLEIGRLQGVLVLRHDPETGTNVEHTYHKYTESLDSALTLGDADTLMDALEDLRTGGWLPDNWKEKLCRLVCIHALKARTSMESNHE